MRFPRGAALAVALVLAAGCSGEQDEPQTTIGDPPSEENQDEDGPEDQGPDDDGSDEDEGPAENGSDDTEDPADNDFAVPDDPDDIDAAYLEGVLAEFEQVYLDALLALRDSDGDVTPATFQRLDAIYGPEEVDRSVEILLSDANNDFEGLRTDDEIGPQVNEIEEVFSASADCVYLRAETDFSAVAVSDPGPRDVYFRLGRARTDRMNDQQRSYNPTPWMIAYERTPLEEGDREILEADACE